MGTDPLSHLPAELILRVLLHVDISSLANLTRTSSAWCTFIQNDSNQNAIYYEKTQHSPGQRTFDFLDQCIGTVKSFTKYYQDVPALGWKELCKRQRLLHQNWRGQLRGSNGLPVTRTTLIGVPNRPVWRIRPDFDRRFILTTSERGGLHVTDMDSGELLWALGEDVVRRYAHLEYSHGWAVFDREGDAVEIWKASDMQRGRFDLKAIKPHDVQTRGFHLIYPTLCVVSTQGKGFVYDLSRAPYKLQTEMAIEHDAVGHLDQNPEDTVMYSLGRKGYHLHSKSTGHRLGVIHPKNAKTFYHIQHPASLARAARATGSRLLEHPGVPTIPPAQPSIDRLVPLTLHPGPMPADRTAADHPPFDSDEWGAGMLHGDVLVAVSRGGRLFFCSDWPGALRSPERFDATAAVVECAGDPTLFYRGGWLSIRDGRVLFEVHAALYIMHLPDGYGPNRKHPEEEGGAKQGEEVIQLKTGPGQPPIFASPNSSPTPADRHPISWMALQHDCIVTTHSIVQPRTCFQPRPGLSRHPAGKVVRVLSFAPDTGANGDAAADVARDPLVESLGEGYAYAEGDVAEGDEEGGEEVTRRERQDRMRRMAEPLRAMLVAAGMGEEHYWAAVESVWEGMDAGGDAGVELGLVGEGEGSDDGGDVVIGEEEEHEWEDA